MNAFGFIASLAIIAAPVVAMAIAGVSLAFSRN